VARLLRTAEPIAPMSVATRDRIARRLSAEDAPRRRVMRPAWGLAALILFGATAATAGYYRRAIVAWVAPTRLAPPKPPAPLPAPSFTRPVAPAVETAPPPVETEAPLQEQPPAPTHDTRSASPKATRGHPQQSGEQAPSMLARESEAIGRAMTALRRDKAPRRALTMLDDYDRDFPAGTLRTEAMVLRVDALIAAGDEKAALAHLARLSPAALAPLPRLRLLRGELRARLGNCAEALSDFDALWALPSAGALHADALFGRASCRSALGQTAAARADYQHYLDSFPAGRHAAAARAALGR
jgi:hypothetical protein